MELAHEYPDLLHSPWHWRYSRIATHVHYQYCRYWGQGPGAASHDSAAMEAVPWGKLPLMAMMMVVLSLLSLLPTFGCPRQFVQFVFPRSRIQDESAPLEVLP